MASECPYKRQSRFFGIFPVPKNAKMCQIVVFCLFVDRLLGAALNYPCPTTEPVLSINNKSIRIHQWYLDLGKSITVSSDLSKKAGAVPFMARSADLNNLHEQAVLIAVHIDTLYALGIAGCFTFDPIFLTRAAPKCNAFCRDRAFNRLSVHITHHQDLIVIMILDHRSDQPRVIKLQSLWNLHPDTPSICWLIAIKSSIHQAIGQPFNLFPETSDAIATTGDSLSK